MDVIEHHEDAMAEHHSSEDITVNEKCESSLDPLREPENRIDSFDCNICFDSAHDPVVTLCGHLYCWACIFKWLNVQSSSDSNPVRQQACPICKAGISQVSLIPLYSHGPSPTESEPENPSCDFIPPRPVHRLQTHSSSPQFLSDPFQPQFPAFHHQYLPIPFGHHTTMLSSNLVSTTIAGIINPTIGFLGELVYTRMFGSSNASSFTYPVPSSYATLDHNNTRPRGQELRLDRLSYPLIGIVQR
ncbi:hypothetical protein Cgig2_001019 [Carnegiea gigantea]|uniref:E3 ubiquitin-protein ligase RMA n=1 Tax=Carnegiea gigantea TaxID=171969 RepID=A0A9Q1JQ32_9CARY|nr:hypothetical protein Cgig2_001019 [Carnegiea gigantea]